MGQHTFRPRIASRRSTVLALLIGGSALFLAACVPAPPPPPPADTTAPPVPSTPNLKYTSDSGDQPDDDITNDTTPTLEGTATEAGSIVDIYDNSTKVGSATATGGYYIVTVSVLLDGNHLFSAKARDAAGNTSAASGELAVRIDTVAPVAVITSPADNATGVTSPVTFAGTAGNAVNDSESVTVTYGGGNKLPATQVGGVWTAPFSVSVSPGVNTAFVTPEPDLAGNAGIQSPTVTFTVT